MNVRMPDPAAAFLDAARFANPHAIEYTLCFLEVLPSALSRVESRPSLF
jgi:hypothetical protein